MRDDSLIRTDTGMAVLSFKDGTRFVLGRNSQMEVTANGIRLDKGSGYYVFPTSGKRIEVTMPTGRIGVRGTAFSLAVDDQSTTVRLVEGTLEIIPDSASAVTIEAGTQVVLTPTGVTGPNAFDGPAEEATWQRAAAAVPNALTSVVDRPDPTALAVVTGAVVALLVLLAGWIGLRRRRRARVAQ